MVAQPLPGPRRLSDGRSLYWWGEIGLVGMIALFVVLIGPSLAVGIGYVVASRFTRAGRARSSTPQG